MRATAVLCACLAAFGGGAVAAPGVPLSPAATAGRTPTDTLAALPGLSRVVLSPLAIEASNRTIRSQVPLTGVNPHLASTARPGQKAGAPALPASIVELARALRNDADLIYEFVRNNIDYYPVWGMQKGALGALLDNQGTAADQAMLMVALLRQAGYTASFVVGQIALTDTDIANWLGVSTANACAVQDVFVAGSVPIGSTSSQSGGCDQLASIEVGHVWVKVDINGTNYVFDPAFKPHALKTGIDLAAATGYSAATFLNAAKTGATQTGDYIQNLNRNNIRSNLTSLAANLATFVRANLPAGELADLVGGMAITPFYGPALRQAALPYQTVAAVTEYNDLPDALRITLRIQYAGIDQTFTSDALGGTRLTITYDGTNHAVLSLDGTAVGTSVSALTPGSIADPVTIQIKHNAYGPSPADVTFTQTVTAGGAYLVGNAWGPATRGPANFHGTRLKNARAAGAGDTSEAVIGSTLAVLSATWLAQADASFRIIDRLGATTTTYHHQVGIVGHDKAGYVDLPANLVTITSQSREAAREDAVFFAQGMHASIFESAVVEQTTGISAVSTIKLLDLANAAGNRIYDARSANYNGAVAPNLLGCTAGKLSTFSAATTAGRRLILPQHCDLNENSWTGTGYLDIAANQSSLGLLIDGNLAGGYATTEQPAIIMVGNLNDKFVNYNPKPVELAGPTTTEPIDLPSGNYLYSRTDLTTGAGAYPQSLSFDRLYTSGSRTADGPLGRGWAQGFAIRVATASDGLQGLGEDAALDSVAAVTGLMVSFDLMLDPARPLDKLVAAAIGQRWFGDQLTGNTATVVQGLKYDTFVRLPDGTYNPPPGNPAKLIRNDDNTFSLEGVHKDRMNFDASNRIATHVFTNGMQVNFTYTGSNLSRVQNSVGRALDLTYSSGRLSAVSDGVRSVGYGYDGNANLVSFIDALNNASLFLYDVPGRLTQIYYPGFPGTAAVANVYDSLDRVKSQANASGKVWTYYFAGTRAEEVAPDATSTITYHDGMGRVVRSVDAAGQVVLNTYDGQSRLVKTVRPEGNGYEFVFDDAPCLAQLRCTHNVKTKRMVPKPGSGLPTSTFGYVYESAFNRESSVIDARGHATDYTYNAQGDLAQLLRPQDANGVRPQADFTYSAVSPGGGFPPFTQLTKYSILAAVGDAIETTMTYDAANRFVPKTKIIDSAPGKLNLTTTYTHDAIGNMTQIDGPRIDVSDITSFAWDAERRVTQTTDALGHQQRMFFDADGRPIREATQLGSGWMTRCLAYTASGKLILLKGPYATASDAICPDIADTLPMIEFQYDDLDRLAKRTEYLPIAQGGNRVTQRTYTADGRPKTVQTAVGSGLAQAEQTYTYTPNGLVATFTDALNHRTTTLYDGLDRRRRTLYPDKASPGTSSATDFEQYGYDENGNLTSLRTRKGDTVTFGYDNLDRQVSRTYPDVADNVTLGYDLIGRAIAANLPNGSHNVTWTWDHRDRLLSTTAGGRTVTHLYDAMGNRVRTTWPEATPFYVTTDYDALNRPVAIRELGASALATYAYDDLSRRTTVTLGNGTTTSFTYDGAGGIATLAHDLAGAANDVTYAYARNRAQEITNVTATNTAYEWDGAAAGSTSYASNGLNQYTSVGGVAQSYDASGNLGSNGTSSYAFDGDNRLRTVTGPVAATLAWDGAGRMRATTVGGTSTQLLYDDQRLIAEYDGGGALLRRYVHGPGIDEPLARYEGAGTASRQWYYVDHQGSVVTTADAGGNATATITYGPFGEPGATAPARFGYTGQQFLAGLGLYHFRARFYSPSLGRFLQPDPAGVPGGVNLYAYTGNNPVNGFDPTGLWTVQIGIGAGGIAPGFLGGLTGGGIAFDDKGNVGWYAYAGGGTAIGTEAGAGASIQFSNAKDIYDLAGRFENYSAVAGAAVARVSLDAFYDNADKGYVKGFGFTAGVGAGVGAVRGATWTQICAVTFWKCAGPLTDWGFGDGVKWLVTQAGRPLISAMDYLDARTSEAIKPIAEYIAMTGPGRSIANSLDNAYREEQAAILEAKRRGRKP